MRGPSGAEARRSGFADAAASEAPSFPKPLICEHLRVLDPKWPELTSLVPCIGSRPPVSRVTVLRRPPFLRRACGAVQRFGPSNESVQVKEARKGVCHAPSGVSCCNFLDYCCLPARSLYEPGRPRAGPERRRIKAPTLAADAASADPGGQQGATGEEECAAGTDHRYLDGGRRQRRHRLE